MHNPGQIKTFTASGDIAAKRIVSIGADFTASQAVSGTSINLGVTELACAEGDAVDVIMSGIAEVEAGGTISCNDLITFDSNGKAIAAENEDAVLGVALDGASAGELVSVRIVPQRAGVESVHPSNVFTASGAIAAKRIVTAAVGGKVSQASSSTSVIVGVAKSACENGAAAEIVVNGIAEIEASASIACGDYITSDSDGKAAVAGNTDSVLGIALGSAAAGESVSVYIARDRPGVNPVSNTMSFVANADVAAGRLVAIFANGTSSRIQYASSSTANIIGVTAAAGSRLSSVDVIVSGVVEVPVSEPITCGQYVGASYSGLAQAAGSGSAVLGIALQTASGSTLCPVLITQGRASKDDLPEEGLVVRESVSYDSPISAYKLVKRLATGYASQATSSDPLIGVRPADGQGGSGNVGILIHGIMSLHSTDTVTAGDYIGSDDSGDPIVVSSSGKYYVGMALTGSNSSGYFNLLVSPGKIT